MPRINVHGDDSTRDNPVDVHVGSQIRYYRIGAGINLEELGAALGVAKETMEAYESGVTRIGSTRLYEVSTVLSCSPRVFFDGVYIERGES
jgi:transcriptional regulator with XRE-family HTH domain